MIFCHHEAALNFAAAAQHPADFMTISVQGCIEVFHTAQVLTYAEVPAHDGRFGLQIIQTSVRSASFG